MFAGHYPPPLATKRTGMMIATGHTADRTPPGRAWTPDEGAATHASKQRRSVAAWLRPSCKASVVASSPGRGLRQARHPHLRHRATCPSAARPQRSRRVRAIEQAPPHTLASVAGCRRADGEGRHRLLLKERVAPSSPWTAESPRSPHVSASCRKEGRSGLGTWPISSDRRGLAQRRTS